MRILRDQTAAVMIDIQERLYPVMHNKEALLDRLVMLVKGLKLMNIPVVAAQQYTKGLGETVEPLKSLFSDFKIVEKICFSCCDEPKLMDEITALGKKFIIIAGIEAHVCVLQTVSDLLEKGYTPVVIADCISSRNPYDKEIAIERMRSEGAVITTSESVLFELCRTSGAEEFRSLSKLVK